MDWFGISFVVIVCLVILFTLLGTLLWDKKDKHNGYFVACGSNEVQIGYSDDGIDWNASTHIEGGLPFGTSGVAYDLVKANGIWVAVGNPSGSRTRQIIWSGDNGITWNDSTGNQFSSDSSAEGLTIAFGNGVWVAGGKGAVTSGTTLVYSRNGKDWSTVNNDPFGNGEGTCTVVQYVNGRFLAGGKGSTGSVAKIWSSTDGINWTAATGTPFGTNAASNPTKFTYGKGVYVAVGLAGDDANTKWRSTNGIAWTASAISGFGNGVTIWDVKFHNNLFVAAGVFNSGGPVVAWSTDGDTWTAGTGTGTLSSGYFMDNILIPDQKNNKWLIGGGTGSNGLAFYSTDGKDWTQVTDTLFPGGAVRSTTGGWKDKSFHSDVRYMAVGNASGSQNVYYSSDKVNWTQADSVFGSGTGNTIDQVKYG